MQKRCSTDTRLSAQEQLAVWEQVWTSQAAGGRKRICLFNLLVADWVTGWIDLREMDVVEVGGAGQIPKLLSPHAKSATCFDYSTKALELARKVCEGLPNVRFVEGDLFDQRSEEYDVVVSNGLIEHYFSEERLKCLRQHARMARQYIVVGAPSDLPHNWWRAARTHATSDLPPWTPISESELRMLMIEADVTPVAMTRIDPDYGHRSVSPWRLFCRIAMRLGVGRSTAIDHPAGGILIGIGKVGPASHANAHEEAP